jgi:hypothetical protein
MNPRLNRPRSGVRLKWLPLLTVLLIVVAPLAAAPAGAVERISRSDLKPLKDGMPGEEGLEKELVLAPDVRMAATIEVTAKGNDSLRVGNLKLKVFDSHNDGSYYENEMLKIEFPDIDADGKRELVISGIVCFTDEKGDKVLRREAVVFIYALQPNRTFKQIYHNTSFRLD